MNTNTNTNTNTNAIRSNEIGTAHGYSSWLRRSSALVCLLELACAARPAANAQSNATAVTASAPADTALARGGRLFDNWAAEKQLGKSFVPDNAKTAELDGRGGPNGNGTLNDGNGQPLPNSGHDYRLKNLFGWDLRGSAGVYGAEYQAKSYVLDENLLAGADSEEQMFTRLQRGDSKLPAYGAVLDEADLRSLSGFIIAVRERRLPRPDGIFALAAQAPKGYRLLGGADPAKGRAYFAARCATCHGATGTKRPIDDTESVGSVARSSGYEVWLKILNGQPGTKMGPQLHPSSAAQQTNTIRNLLAALCDRSAFPPLDPKHDVPDADARCAEYLK